MENKKLAIAIPTYNRASILRENLELMIAEIKQFSIPIYISDDSTDGKTALEVEALKKTYEFIHYYKNEPGLGHDKNCIRSLSLPTAAYIWYLGDSIIIEPGGIKKVLDIIENGQYDFISVNAKNRNLDFSSRIYDDANTLLTEIGWHLTLTSATIYSNKIQGFIHQLDLAKCKNFPQTALIFETFAKQKSKLFWINDRLLYGNVNKKSYWNNAVFDVFLFDWEFFISNLPPLYSNENKMLILKKHNLETGLFTFMRFLDYRALGIYSFDIFRKYYKQISYSSSVNVFVLVLISITPKFLLVFLKNIFYPGR